MRMRHPRALEEFDRNILHTKPQNYSLKMFSYTHVSTFSDHYKIVAMVATGVHGVLQFTELL